MHRVINLIFGMSRKIVQIGLHSMFNIMKIVIHWPLRFGPNILQTKWEFLVWKCSPRSDKWSLRLIHWENVDLIISGENIHEWIDFTTNTVINNLVNEWGQIIFLQTSAINISIIDAYTDCAMFLHDRDNMKYPINERNKVDETSMKDFFNFTLYLVSLLWMN